MKLCLISLAAADSGDYSVAALRQLHPKLKSLGILPYDQKQQLQVAATQAGKISVQGMQPKFSASLSLSQASFELVEQGGTYIVKPQHLSFPELPENEAFTMLIARRAGFEVPPSGLLRCSDGTLSYFIQRFDRSGGKKLAVEDFGQLAELPAENKYQSSIEKILALIERYASFPAVAKLEYFRRLVFSFVFGNEDMHLKNLSLISRTRRGVLVHGLSPNYDLLNTTAAYLAAGRRLDDIEEVALPWQGRKRKLRRRDFAALAERAGLSPQSQASAYALAAAAARDAVQLLPGSWLSADLQSRYVEVLRARDEALELGIFT